MCLDLCILYSSVFSLPWDCEELWKTSSLSKPCCQRTDGNTHLSQCVTNMDVLVSPGKCHIWFPPVTTCNIFALFFVSSWIGVALSWVCTSKELASLGIFILKGCDFVHKCWDSFCKFSLFQVFHTDHTEVPSGTSKNCNVWEMPGFQNCSIVHASQISWEPYFMPLSMLSIHFYLPLLVSYVALYSLKWS